MPKRTLEMDINQDEKLDISIERVEKINSPLLVIGLGGTGTDIVRTIKRTFAERYVLPQDRDGNFIPVPDKTAYLTIDSTMMGKDGLDLGSEVIDITIPGIQAILNPKERDFNLTPFERGWVNKNLDAASAGHGAGTYRQAARFMLFRKHNEVMQAITRVLQRITGVDAGAANINGRTEIVIATGICGGTGSGTFLDIAQMVRHIMETDPQLNNLNYSITGYIVMPDISIANVTNAVGLVGILQRNGYAALKELDFWMRIHEHETPYVAQPDANTVIEWKSKPFDACILMSGTTVDGMPYNDAYKVVQKTIAENLLHYLANEEANLEGDAAYTYIQYENNLKATVAGVSGKMPLPVLYGYRAIGAYTKRIPKRKILYFEGSKLLELFIPQRDDNNTLVPSKALFNDGKAVERAQKIVDNIKTMYTNFSQHVQLPNFCNVEASDKGRLDHLRVMNPQPHNRADTEPQLWRTTTVRPAAISSADNYLKAAWARFESFATSVITDRALGPFSLRAYLEDGQGLMIALDNLRDEWNANAANFTKAEGGFFDACRAKWKDFVKPPLLGGGKAIASYLEALNGYYNSVRRSTYMTEFASALSRLVLRIREYVLDSLGPLCENLLTLEKTFGDTRNNNTQLESDIFDMEAIKNRIQQELAINNDNDRIIKNFLGELCTESFENRANVDSHTSGVSFTFRENTFNKLLVTVRKSLNDCFTAINGQSLDSIMLQTVGSDVVKQQEYMNSLGSSVLTSATPMFSQDPAYAAELKAPYSYLSVPDDSPVHIERYRKTLGTKNVSPKGSSIRDHIYCVTAWDALPLYRYSQMEAMEKAYDKALHNPQDSMGVHLVWNGSLDADYTNNWTKLPSPRPYYFFSQHGPAVAQQRYSRTRDLVQRAEKSGLMNISNDTPNPVLKLNFLYVSNQLKSYKASEMIRSEVDAIVASKDPVTGNTLQPAQVRDRIEQYLVSAYPKTLSVGRSPECMAASLGLHDQPCNPWDPAIQANPQMMSKAYENHATLCREMAVAIILLYPTLDSALEQQVEGVEYARSILNGIKNQANVWGRRIQSADKFSKYIIYQVIIPSMKGFEYIDSTGEHVSAIQEHMLDAGLKTQLPIVQCASHLSDLPQENPIRIELERKFTDEQETLQERQHKHILTVQDIEAYRKRVKLLVKMCGDERSFYKAKQRAANANVQENTNILALLDALMKSADSEDRNFAFIQASLSE